MKNKVEEEIKIFIDKSKFVTLNYKAMLFMKFRNMLKAFLNKPE
jgi:hypothetical protein